MGTHSVEKHLRVTAEQYDAVIRTFVPYYDEMLKTGIDLVKALAKKSPHILDLGGGTGALTQAILRDIPDAKIELIDIDPYMLAEAKRRLSLEKERVSFKECSFFDSLLKSDVVVASLSLHHVPTIEQKTKVYAAIVESLKSGIKQVFCILNAFGAEDQ